MKGRKLTDKELETVAKAVVAAGSNAGDVDGLVSDTKLYHGVLAKIAAECETGARSSRFAWKPVAAFAVLILVVSVSFVVYFGPGSDAPRATETNLPDTMDEIRSRQYVNLPEEPSQPLREPELVKTALKRPVGKPRVAKTRRAKQPAANDGESVFHPLGFAERAEDAAIDGRVVRVEMPRSALFALGVDLPLENGTRSIKADLLVGADGSPRAIRLVE